MTDPAAWTSWLDGPPHRYERVEWVRVRDGRITDCGTTIPATLPPQWNVAGLWWRPCALPGEDKAAWLKGWKAAREAAATKALDVATSNNEVGEIEAAWGAEEAATAIRAMEPPKQETKG
jgi:hypothetical protein